MLPECYAAVPHPTRRHSPTQLGPLKGSPVPFKTPLLGGSRTHASHRHRQVLVRGDKSLGVIGRWVAMAYHHLSCHARHRSGREIHHQLGKLLEENLSIGPVGEKPPGAGSDGGAPEKTANIEL